MTNEQTLAKNQDGVGESENSPMGSFLWGDESLIPSERPEMIVQNPETK